MCCLILSSLGQALVSSEPGFPHLCSASSGRVPLVGVRALGAVNSVLGDVQLGQMTLVGAARGGGISRLCGSSCWKGSPAPVSARFPTPDSARLLAATGYPRTVAFLPGSCQGFQRQEGSSPLLPACFVVPLAARSVCHPVSSQHRPGFVLRYSLQGPKEVRRKRIPG